MSDDFASLEGELPHVQVVRGEPDDIELAALVAGLAAAAGDLSDDLGAPAASAWMDRTRAMRSRLAPPGPPAPGVDAWRWSLRG